jgi:hypothetical protein
MLSWKTLWPLSPLSTYQRRVAPLLQAAASASEVWPLAVDGAVAYLGLLRYLDRQILPIPPLFPRANEIP